MSADQRKKQTTPAVHEPPPVEGAHHGPGAGPGESDTVAVSTNRLKKRGVLSYRVLGVIVIVLVAIFVYRFIASTRSSTQSREWLALEQASSIDKLEAIVKLNSNSYPGK